MKKLTILASAVVALMLNACGSLDGQQGSTGQLGSAILGSLAQSATNPNTLGNLLQSIIGLDKMDQAAIIGTWHYQQPGVAFTSESTLAAAGGEVAAGAVKEKLATHYSKLGFKSSNTSFTFKQDGTYAATLLGKNVNGTYTFDQPTQAITLNVTILGVPAYSLQGFVKRNTDGMALLFESKKILQILQTVGAASGNQTVSSISSLASNYDGVRVGFDLKK